MNSSSFRLQAAFVSILFYVLYCSIAFAGNYTWTGSTNKNWNTSSNWSPVGIPSTNDTVNLGSGNDTILLVSNTGINRLVMNGRTIHLSGYELEVLQRSILNSGSIYDGTLKLRGASATFAGTQTDCLIDCIVGQLEFNGGIINGEGSFEQNGSAGGYGTGGCVFNAPAIIKKTTNGILRMGQALPDTFNSTVEFVCINKTPLEISYGSASVFNDRVFLSCYGANSEISIGNDIDSVYFNGDAALSTGSEGLQQGIIKLKRISQSNSRVDNELSGDEVLVISMESCTWNGAMVLSAPSILLKNSVFMEATTLTKRSAATNNYSYGGNSFYGSVLLENQDGNYAFRFANNAGDHFYNELSFATGSRIIQMAYTGTSYFEGDINNNGAYIRFNTNNGQVVLSGEKDQTLEGSHPYQLCKFEVNKVAGMVQLNQQMSIDSSVTFVNGIIRTDSVITLKAAVTCSGAGNQSFVDGPVKKIGNTAFAFPVGDEGQWNPIEITAPANATDAFTAQNFLNPQTYGNNKDTTIYRLNTCSYWNLVRNTGSSQVHVKLNWDSLRCTLYDTAGLGVASWNGNKWKDLGAEGITGNVLDGSIFSSTISSSYIAFTWAYRTTANSLITINTSPELSSTTNQISEDYFGYNGANVIEDGQYYSDLASNPITGINPVLKYNGISTIRLNGGTFGNYWDWRTSWFIPENQLPNNWFYTRRSHKQALPTKVNNTFVNDMSFFKVSNDIVGSRPIFQLNSLTSSFNYEIASLYRAGELNLPVRYIELGNEFYLNDEQYKERFPSSLDYINFATDFTNQLKSIAPFQNVEVAVVGSSTPNGIPGRRSSWLDVILDNINKFPTHRPDAITIHEYYASGLKEPINVTPTNSNIGKMLIKPFIRRDQLLTEELHAIAAKNASLAPSPPLEVWLTEYNLDETKGNNIGTWAHGLFNAIQTLTYLESPLITHVNSHAMTSNAVFGNIFENDRGFKSIEPDQLPANVVSPDNFVTDTYGFTASGAALNEIALALKGNNVIARRIEFENLPGGTVNTISYYDDVNGTQTSNYLELYGWSFEKENGTEAIILNLGPNDYVFGAFDKVCLSNGNFENFTSQVTITSENNGEVNGNGGLYLGEYPAPDIGIDELLYTSGEKSVTASNILFKKYSLTRLIYRKPNVLSIRLTDNEICAGSNTSLLIQGKPYGSICTVTCSSSSNSRSFNLTDSVLIFGSDMAPGNYTITAIVLGSSFATINPISLTIHDQIISSVTISPPTTLFDPCTASAVTLEANVNMPAGGNLSNSYTYLWVPDQHISSGQSTGQIVVDLNKITIEAYQVFVFNDQCWASSAPYVIERSPVKVDLGEDFTTCASKDFTIRAEVDQSAFTSLPYDLKYTLKRTSGPSINQSNNSTFLITGLPVGTYTYTVEVWLDDGTGTFNSCPAVTDEIIVSVKACCNCSSANNPIELNPKEYEYKSSINGIVYSSYYNVSTMEDLYASLTTPNPNFNVSFPNNTTIEIKKGNASPIPVICINGDFWVNPAKLGNQTKETTTIIFEECTLRLGANASIKTRGRAKLILKSCVIESCNGSELWDGIYADISDQGLAEPELQITQLTNGPRSKIKHAKNGIVIRRDSPYAIEYCDFEDNYIDIKIEKCGSIIKQVISGTSMPINYVRSNIFTSSGGLLLPPYDNVHKFAAIMLDEVERFVLGDSSDVVFRNFINNSTFGVRATNSSFEVYNNEFTEIEDLDGSPIRTMSGSAIFGDRFNAYSDRKILIGATTAGIDTRNVFKSCINGIVSFGEANLKIFNNVFGTQGAPTEAPSKYGIFTRNTGAKNVYITRENTFNNFNVGIRAYELKSAGIYHIGDNSFENSMSNIPSNPTSFEGTAIWVGNPIKLTGFSRVNNLKIFRNRIGNPDNLTQARIGIFVSSITEPLIEYNEIHFQVDAVPPYPMVGIWTQNCLYPKVVDNEILNEESYASHTTLLTGIRSDMNTLGCFSKNQLNYLGNSFHFLGNHGQIGYAENEMNYYDNAIFINNADIGVQGNADFSNNIYRTDDNRFIHTPIGLQPDRVIGSTFSGSFIPWYFNSSNNQLFNPDYIFTGLINSLPVIPNQPNLACPEISTPAARNTAYGFIVRDTAGYDETYASYFNYHAKHGLYDILKYTPEIIDMDDSTDVFYASFFEEMSASTLPQYDSIRQFIEDGDFTSALSLLTNIEDTNEVEESIKYVLGIGLNKLHVDSLLAVDDSTELYDMANRHLLTTGEAGFISRNMLFYEVHDGTLGGGSRVAQVRKPEQSKFRVEMYPIPVKEVVYFNYENDIPEAIEIYDIQQRCILKTFAVNSIEVATLAPGSYLVRFLQGYEVLTTKKLIKM